jgi:hypothetical protein
MSIKKSTKLAISLGAFTLAFYQLSLIFGIPFTLNIPFALGIPIAVAIPSYFESEDPISTIVVEQKSQKRSTNSESLQATDVLVAYSTDNLTIDIGKKQAVPIDLILAQPFRSIPAGALVKATILPTEDSDAVIIADAIIFNSKSIDISAQSDRLAGTTVRVSTRTEEAQKNSIPAAILAGTATIAFDGDTEEAIVNAFRGALGGVLIGALSPKDVRLIQIPKDKSISLTVK